MNNSDLIAALSLALTAIIFLVQADDGLLKLKIKRHEKWALLFILCLIIFLTNSSIFERFHLTFYFSLYRFYLLPSEWALILFLFLIGLSLYRIFSPKIFANQPSIILQTIKKYRQEKKWFKLKNLLWETMDLKDFEELYAEKLNESIFCDHHILEIFASDYPEILIKFQNRYPGAAYTFGENIYYILNGLFADKSNPIYSEIRQYQNEFPHSIFISEMFSINYDNKELLKYKPKQTVLPLILWLTEILYEARDLKENIKYYLQQLPEYSEITNPNTVIYSGEQIETLLSRNPIYNSIKLFRILLIEYCLKYKKVHRKIPEPLLLFYSSWDFVTKSMRADPSEKVRLNNDAYTIYEYILKYLFESYLSIYFLLRYKLVVEPVELDDDNDYSAWVIQKLSHKLAAVIGARGIISEASKEYYLHSFFDLYFEAPRYFFDNEREVEKFRESILWQLKDTLKDTPFGDVALFRERFDSALNSYDFIQHDSKTLIGPKKQFYDYLLPFTEKYKWTIVRS